MKVREALEAGLVGTVTAGIPEEDLGVPRGLGATMDAEGREIVEAVAAADGARAVRATRTHLRRHPHPPRTVTGPVAGRRTPRGGGGGGKARGPHGPGVPLATGARHSRWTLPYR